MNSAHTSDGLWFDSLSGDERAQFLALLAHGLTISQRVLCFEGVLESVKQLNEAHHQIASLLVEQLQGGGRPAVALHLFELTDKLAYDQGIQAWKYARSSLAG